MDSTERYFEEYGTVDEVQIDDEFEAHLAKRATYEKHRVSGSEVLEVHANAPKFFRNTGAHRAPVVMIGPTYAGRIICVPIEPTGQSGVWRAITAFDVNMHHKEKYQRY